MAIAQRIALLLVILVNIFVVILLASICFPNQIEKAYTPAPESKTSSKIYSPTIAPARSYQRPPPTKKAFPPLRIVVTPPPARIVVTPTPAPVSLQETHTLKSKYSKAEAIATAKAWYSEGIRQESQSFDLPEIPFIPEQICDRQRIDVAPITGTFGESNKFWDHNEQVRKCEWSNREIQRQNMKIRNQNHSIQNQNRDTKWIDYEVRRNNSKIEVTLDLPWEASYNASGHVWRVWVARPDNPTEKRVSFSVYENSGTVVAEEN